MPPLWGSLGLGCRGCPSTHTEHRATGTTLRAGPHPRPGSFCRLGDVHQQVQLAKAQRMMNSKTEPYICWPLYLLGMRSAAVTCSVMALKYRKPWVQVFPFLMLRGSGCRVIPLLSPEVESPLPPGTSGLSQPSLGVTLSPVTAHMGSALLSAAPGRLPHRVHSAGGVAVGTSCNSALSCSKGLLLPRLELGREWHRTGPQICPSGAVWRVWRGNATLFPSSESSSSISGYGTTPLCRAHIPDRAGTGTHQTLLSFCSSSTGRAAEWERGINASWKDPSFSSHQTTPTAHSQPECVRHREPERVTNPLPLVTDTAVCAGSLTRTSEPQARSQGQPGGRMQIRMPLSWRSRAELCATRQVSRSCCLTLLALLPRRTEDKTQAQHGA